MPTGATVAYSRPDLPSGVSDCHKDVDLLTERFRVRHTRGPRRSLGFA
jgi:hypothetical protein